jgi:threonine dehydratase
MYREHTPVECHSVLQKNVNVKRDDLYSLPPAPALGKLRGMRSFLKTLLNGGTKIVGCFQTRVSNVGHALAAACLEFPGLHAVVVYPQLRKQERPESVRRAERLGATVCAIRPNVLPICYQQSKRLLAEMGGVLLPFGMDCVDAVDAVVREATLLPASVYRAGTVIVPCGSGVTLGGVLRGIRYPVRRVVGVSCGRSVEKIRKCVEKYISIPPFVDLVAPSLPYYQSPRTCCPFPAHPHYDLKAWKYLAEHLDELQEPILFWNVGA